MFGEMLNLDEGSMFLFILLHLSKSINSKNSSHSLLIIARKKGFCGLEMRICITSKTEKLEEKFYREEP